MQIRCIVNDWKNISILSNHETIKVRRVKNKTINEKKLCLIRDEERYSQQFLERLFAIRVLGSENVVRFRGTHEQLFTARNGNFLKIIECFYLILQFMHILKSFKKSHIHNFGKSIQTELNSTQ